MEFLNQSLVNEIVGAFIINQNYRFVVLDVTPKFQILGGWNIR